MSEPPDQSSQEPPPRQPSYESSWDESRRELNLSGPEFQWFFDELEKLLCEYPMNQYVEILVDEDLLLYPTLDAFQDVPPLWVYYRLRPGETVFVGLRRNFADTTFVPSIWE